MPEVSSARRQLPQFRVTLNARCGRACFFCRPSGEAVATAASAELPVDDLIRVARVIRKAGIASIKLTGGDPALYGHLVTAVRRLRDDAGFDSIEVISRHPRIGMLATDLAAAGITQFNMSIDTLDPVLHHEICGVDDLPEVIVALKACTATGVPVKVNTVVMAGVNYQELKSIGQFCRDTGVRTLKLLDVIRDMDSGAESFARRLAIRRGRTVRDLFTPLGDIAAQLSSATSRVERRTQGDLGHPMMAFIDDSGFEIITKDSQEGAWYGSLCRNCPFYPCHDALMALRLTADRRLQFCLLRDDVTVPLDVALRAGNGDELERLVSGALEKYAHAAFVGRSPAARVISVESA